MHSKNLKMRFLYLSILCAALVAPSSVFSIENDKPVLRIEEAMRVWQERWLAISGAGQPLGTRNPNRERSGTTPADVFDGPIEWPARKFDGVLPGAYPAECFYKEDLLQPNLAASLVAQLRSKIATCLGAAVAPSAGDQGGIILPFDPYWDHLTPDTQGNNYGGGSIAVYMVELEEGNPVPLLRAPDASRMFKVYDEDSGQWVFPDVSVEPWKSMIDGSVTIENYEQRFEELVEFIQMPMRMNSYFTQVNAQEPIVRNWNFDFFHPDIYRLDCDSCYACAKDCIPGDLNCAAMNASLTIGLGGSVNGPVGALLLNIETPNDLFASPRNLDVMFEAAMLPRDLTNFDNNSDAYIISALVNGVNQPRQIKTPVGLVDIVADAANPDQKYTLYFYDNDNIGALSNGLFTVSPANAYVSIEFEGSGYQTTVQELKVTRTVTGNQSEEIIFSFDTATHTWSYTQGEGDDQRTRVTQRTWIQGDGTQIGDVVQLKTNTLDHKQVVVSSAARKYKIFPWNTDASGSPTSSKSRQYELIEVIEDPDGIARKTTYHYDETDYGSYSANQSVKRLQRVEYPDLSWQSVEYDNYGRWENVYTPFGESTSKEGDHRKTSYEYSEPDSETTLLQRTESTVISGIEQITSRSWTKRRTEGLYTVTTQETAFSESALEGDVANQRFVSREYRLGEHAGRVERSVQADDSVTLYSYDENVNGELTTVVESGTPDDTSDPMAATTVTDGTRTTTITNPQGKVMSRTVVDVESGHTIDSWLATGFDSYGRITSSLHHDGTQDSFVFGCCGLETKTDRNGLMTTYIYDSLDRVYEEFSHPAGEPDNKYHHVRYKYDAEGRLKKTTRLKTKESLDASLPVSIVSEERIYDETGDLSSTKDTRGTTSYSEEVVDGKLQRTTTYPNLTTRIETYLPTGELQSISGTAVAPMKYEYGIDADGRFTKEIRIGDGGAETEWVKSYVDFAGRHYKTVFADNAEVVNTYYPMDDANAERRGKLKSNVQPPDSNDGGAVGVTMLYDYDADGKGSVTAVDMNQNGVIDYAGPDRITRSESDLVEITRDSVTAVVRQSKTMIWETDGVDQSREVSVSEQSIDGLHSWNTVNGLTTYTARTFTTAVDSTVVTTLPDLSTTTQTLKAGRLSSSVKATSGAEVIQSTSLSYDGYGRLEVSSDVWAGDTIYTYELDDQVKTITTPDPDPSASGVGKDAQVTTYLYDEMGRPDTVIRPDGSRTYSKYNDRGLLWRTYGAGTFPQEMIYDAQGRLKTLSTWQEFIDESSFDVSEGKATTTWIYDSVRGWLNSKRYADAQGPSYTYYPSGKLHTRTWARGVVTTYGYNAAGQLTTTDYSDSTPDVTQTYDRAGKPSTIQDAAGLLTYAYTAEGLLDTETYDGSGLIPASVMDRGYDALLRPNHLDVSESANTVQQIGYAYDEASRLQTVSSGLLDSTYAYVPNTSLIDTVTHRNDGVTQMTVTNTHDKLGRLVNVLSNPSASLAISVLYEFNDLNQRTKMTREDNSYWSYDYDDLGQVTDAHKKDSSGGMIPSFDFGIKYDDIGNRRSATRRNAGNDEDVVQKYTSNLLNQYSARSVPNLIDVVGSANADAQVLVNGKQATRSGDLFHKQLVVDNTSDAQWFPLDVIAHDSVAGTYRKE
ncbi:MAG: hypothetical protein MI748_18520, partial [Opitutales bacterium]|nr:hypothetical protein [Opitutales bacterium]